MFWTVDEPMSGPAAAEWYAMRRRWLVCPGTRLVDGRCSCGEADCSEPGAHPATPSWWRQSSTNVGRVRHWWRQAPDRSIVLPTGALFDVLDVPARAGTRALNRFEILGYQLGPVAHTRDGRVLFWVSPGSGMTLLARGGPDGGYLGLDIGLHSVGDYVVAPPCNGSTWLYPPNRCWGLPAAADLISTLAHACRRDVSRSVGTVPAQRTANDREKRER